MAIGASFAGDLAVVAPPAGSGHASKERVHRTWHRSPGSPVIIVGVQRRRAQYRTSGTAKTERKRPFAKPLRSAWRLSPCPIISAAFLTSDCFECSMEAATDCPHLHDSRYLSERSLCCQRGRTLENSCAFRNCRRSKLNSHRTREDFRRLSVGTPETLARTQASTWAGRL